jgi:predicted DNA-binding transcriptional regulator AlpA
MDGIESVFLTKREVCKLVSLSPAHIDRLERSARFPTRFSLTGATNGKVGWLRGEILEWCAARVRRTLKPLADDSV